MEGLRYLRGRNLTVTVTFSLALLTSGRSRDGVDGPTGETDNLEGGLEDAVEGVVGRPLDLGGAEGGAGDFRDRKGEMLVEDLCDLEEAPDIVEKKKKREGIGEKTERNREKDEARERKSGECHMPATAAFGPSLQNTLCFSIASFELSYMRV